MTPHDFITKWQTGGDERRDAQPFFEDLCRLIGHPTPREADPDHTWFTYEYGATKTSGGEGWADVWKKGFFGWEAKGTHRSLEKAYEQLKMYADALQNPPLLVVSDLQTIIVHTNFTNTVKKEYRFTVDQLDDFDTRQILEAVFKHPDTLRPGTTRTAITQIAAEKFTTLAKALRDRGHEPHAVAHFLNRLLFCMFAEDIGLLPSKLFEKMVNASQGNPVAFEKRSRELFAAMHTGGDVAFENIDWFNGGLFEDDATLPLDSEELKLLLDACRLDWSEIEPSIFGTLFERGLDPSKRSQLGAHYTDPDTIMKIVRPVVIEPWLQAWEEEKDALSTLLGKSTTKTKVSRPIANRFNEFLDRLRSFTVLDPACGSGNFLYLALRSLKDIEKRVLIEAEGLGLGRQFPAMGPQNVKGIELNDYAAELARITIWIGEIQWMIQNGYGAKKNPILQPLNQIESRDALLNPDGTEAMWPHADAVIGNPPFLGGRRKRRELGQEYFERLGACYSERVPDGSDFVCYWFDKARIHIRANGCLRSGLVATNSIRQIDNRKVMESIVEQCRIFSAWSDEDWINEGANVRVSLVCFSALEANNLQPLLDGSLVVAIHADLRASTAGSNIDLTKAQKLANNKSASFFGISLAGNFGIDEATAKNWLVLPNANGKPNSDVLRPLWNGQDLTGRWDGRWVIDFGPSMPEAIAAYYEAPFARVEQVVKPVRISNRRPARSRLWWKHGEARPGMRAKLEGLDRFIATSEKSKHRFFVWLPTSVAPDHRLIVFPRNDDTFFGLLSSHIHVIWALAVGSTLEDRPAYATSTCFETFPFPEGLTPNLPASSFASDPRAIKIATAAKALVDARDRWLNPPEWVDRVPEVVTGYPDRIVAKSGHEAELKRRTLTILYNARPAWLNNLHRDLDVAVAEAYGWTWPMSDDEILQRLFALNQARAASQ